MAHSSVSFSISKKLIKEVETLSNPNLNDWIDMMIQNDIFPALSDYCIGKIRVMDNKKDLRVAIEEINHLKRLADIKDPDPEIEIMYSSSNSLYKQLILWNPSHKIKKRNRHWTPCSSSTNKCHIKDIDPTNDCKDNDPTNDDLMHDIKDIDLSTIMGIKSDDENQDSLSFIDDESEYDDDDDDEYVLGDDDADDEDEVTTYTFSDDDDDEDEYVLGEFTFPGFNQEVKKKNNLRYALHL